MSDAGGGADLGAFAELFGLEPPPAPDDAPALRRGLFRRLRESIAASQAQPISPQLAGIYQSKLVSEDTWDDLEEALVLADCGMPATTDIVEALRAEAAAGKVTSGDSLARALADEITHRLAPEPARLPLGDDPTVILVVGVNGSGKTTTIGKLAHRLTELGQKAVIGAGDTFRAAAVEQLAVWADRAGVDIVKQAPGADPGAVAFDAVAAGRARGADVVIIDTAGRLQTQHNLMEELRKVHGVTGKAMDGAPHHVLLVIDSTTGQNGLSQARLFSEAVPVSGLVLTKFDGVARGGIVLAIERELGIPVAMIGVGESIDDLQPFDARAFAEAIFAPDAAA
ncbi:MAG: signal recognition particle-docking protein FtsY [Thermoleophilia bacterium]